MLWSETKVLAILVLENMTQNKSYKDILDASVSVGEREMKKEHRQRFVCMCACVCGIYLRTVTFLQ